jgi:hypothetical protein
VICLAQICVASDHHSGYGKYMLGPSYHLFLAPPLVRGQLAKEVDEARDHDSLAGGNGGRCSGALLVARGAACTGPGRAELRRRLSLTWGRATWRAGAGARPAEQHTRW